MDAGTKPTDVPVNVDAENSIVSVVPVLRATDIAPRPSKNTLLDAPALPSSSSCIPGDANASIL